MITEEIVSHVILPHCNDDERRRIGRQLSHYCSKEEEAFAANAILSRSITEGDVVEHITSYNPSIFAVNVTDNCNLYYYLPITNITNYRGNNVLRPVREYISSSDEGGSLSTGNHNDMLLLSSLFQGVVDSLNLVYYSGTPTTKHFDVDVLTKYHIYIKRLKEFELPMKYAKEKVVESVLTLKTHIIIEQFIFLEAQSIVLNLKRKPFIKFLNANDNKKSRIIGKYYQRVLDTLSVLLRV